MASKGCLAVEKDIGGVMHTVIALIISIPMALWVYKVAKNRERHPMAWAVFTVLAWPIPATIIGLRYRRWLLCGVGVPGIYALSASVIYIYISMLAPQRPPSEVLWQAIPRGIPLALLLLVSLVMIARRCHGRLYGFIHGYIGLVILLRFVLPVTGRYLMKMIEFTTFEVVVTAIGLGSLMVLWLGFILSSRASRKPFISIFSLYSIAMILSHFFSLMVTIRFTTIPPHLSILISCLPLFILLFGVIRAKADDVPEYRPVPTPSKGE
jgi:hypothetical protein